jgi:hypothetical protein
VSSKQFLSALVLVILTALPVPGTVCALLCDTAESATTARHHGPAKDCDEPAPSSTEATIRGISEHGCTAHDAGLRQASLAAAPKAGSSVTSVPLVANLVAVTFTDPPRGASLQYTSPPGTPPSSTAPLVLRI